MNAVGHPRESELLAIPTPLLDGLETGALPGSFRIGEHQAGQHLHPHERQHRRCSILAPRAKQWDRDPARYTTIVTPGYAGIEQYSSDEAGEAGPASQIFMLWELTL